MGEILNKIILKIYIQVLEAPNFLYFVTRDFADFLIKFVPFNKDSD